MNRRTLLRMSMGGTAMGLVANQMQSTARAAGLPPWRFVFIFTPAGREPSWRTGPAGTNFTLGPTMEMFSSHRSRMNIFEGFTHMNFGIGANGHWGPLHCVLAGNAPKHGSISPDAGALTYGNQRTFDHELGDRLGKYTPIPNISMGGLDRNNEANSLGLSWSAPGRVHLPTHDPDKAFSLLFSGGSKVPVPMGNSSDAARKAQAWEKEVLGLSRSQLSAFKTRVGRFEQMQLEAFETQLKQTLDRVSGESPDIAQDAVAMCPNPPTYQALSAGLGTDSFQRQHDLQSRVIAAALACGRTRVVTYQMAGLRSSMTVPGGSGQQHSHSNNVNHYRAFDMYYGARVKFLLDQLASYPEGDGTVLDHTVVVWTSDISWTAIEHDHDNIPLYMWGGLPGRKLKMGQYIKYPFYNEDNHSMHLVDPRNRRIQDVLLTVFHAAGINDMDDLVHKGYRKGDIAELRA